MYELDYSSIDDAIKEAGYDPADRQLEWNSSSICLDGSRTMTVYCHGKFVASAFVEAIPESE